LNLIDINDALDGTLSTHNLASYVTHLSTTVPIAGTVDRAGDLGPNNGVAHWRGTFQLDYKNGPYDAFVQLRYIGSGKYNNTYAQGVDINNNHIPSITYADFNFRYLLPNVPGDWSVFAGVNNAFNQRAPLDPSTGSNGTYTQTSFYDVIGRYFRIGVDFKY
jgi:iron complex outermembrane receptor protein